MDLPDELLVRVLAGAGSAGVASGAAACSRLRGAKQTLAAVRVFASAASEAKELGDAIGDAAARALEGMMGRHEG
eukprot:364349-Chlamydomonas_euryale.AAC.6